MKLQEIEIKKLAIKEKTLPEYIKLDAKNKPIFLKNFLDFDLESEALDNRVNDLSEQWGIPKEFIILEKLKSLEIEDSEDSEDIMLEVYAENISKYSVESPRQYRFTSKSDILRSISDYNAMIKATLDTLKKDIDHYDKLTTEISKDVVPVKISDFVQDSKVIQIKAEFIDYFEIFNSVSLDNNLIAVKLNISINDKNYYKVTNNTKIIEKISSKLLEPIVKKEPDYATIIIIYEKETEYYSVTVEYPKKDSEFMFINIETSVNDNTTVSVMKSKFKDLKIISEKDKAISGDLIIKNFNINNVIFLELLTNNPYISNFFYIDESGKIYSRKDEDQIKSVYMYYDPTGSNTNPEIDKNIITASLSEKNSGKKIININGYKIEMFENYFNIRIRNAPNLDEVLNYRTQLSYLFGKYKKDYETIKKEYEKFIDNFKPESTTVKKTAKLTNIKMLEKNFPDIFITGYARALGNPEKQPIIYDPENEEHQNLEQFRFPIDSESEANIFVCGKNRHPNLFLNKLANKDVYKYLPVCNPEDTKKTLEELLEERETETEKESKKLDSKAVQQKAVWFNKKGMIPKNINMILGDNFFRTGTVRDENNSFIHAVLLAFDKNYIKSQDKKEYVSDFRRNLASKPSNTCSQELWDLTENEINEKILDEDVVFDSKLFIAYLENYFNCRIYIFSRLEEPNTTFEIPRYNIAYLNNFKNKNIVLYKSLGGEGDGLKSPVYELIYDSKNNKKVFKHSEEDQRETVNRLRFYFDKVYNLSVLDNSYKVSKFKSKITSQSIDIFGKVRGLNFGKLTMLVSPISNSETGSPSSEKFENNESTLEEAISFIEENSLKITELDTSKDNKVIGILTNAFDYSYIPVIGSEISSSLDNIPISTNRSIIPKQEESILELTKNNKKIADFMMQLALYSFSLQLNNSKSSEKNLDILNEYYSDQINTFIGSTIIDPNNDFLENIPRQFTLNSSFFKDGKLIVDSEKTKEKLKWFLHYSVNFNSKIVLNYKDKKYLNNYYIYLKDFTQDKNEKIFINTNSFKEWMESKIFENKILDTPDPENIYVQFFWNWRLKTITDNKVVLIQNVQDGDLKKALAVSKIYNREGYNAGYYLVDGVEAERIEAENYTEIYFTGNLLVISGDSNLFVFKYPSGKYASLLLV